MKKTQTKVLKTLQSDKHKEKYNFTPFLDLHNSKLCLVTVLH